jgi:hypothetical protein
MALLKLKRFEEADGRFERLIAYGKKHLNDKIKMDYFAVSLPDLLIWEDDLTFRNRIHCLYLQGLGYIGKTDIENATAMLSEAAKLDVNHQGVQQHLDMAKEMEVKMKV